MKISILKNKFLRNLIVLAFWLCLWEVLPRVFDTGVYFPTFFNTIKALITSSKEFIFWQSIMLSLLRVLIGFIVAAILGIAFGIMCSYNSIFDDLFSFILNIIKATPVASFIIIALIFIKTAYLPIFICFLMILPIFFENTKGGIKSIDSDLLEVLKIYDISGYKYLKKVLIPSLKPFIYSAVLASFGLGWKAAISAEVIAQPKYGIGTMLFDARIYLETENLFAYTLCIILLSVAFEKIVKHYANKLGGGNYATK